MLIGYFSRTSKWKLLLKSFAIGLAELQVFLPLFLKKYYDLVVLFVLPILNLWQSYNLGCKMIMTFICVKHMLSV